MRQWARECTMCKKLLCVHVLTPIASSMNLQLWIRCDETTVFLTFTLNVEFLLCLALCTLPPKESNAFWVFD